jgi:uncharacterized protein YbjQ (UPF0145 family)
MKVSVVRTTSGDAVVEYDEEALLASQEALEALLLDAQRVIASALLDIQPNMTSDEGWIDRDDDRA